MDVRFKSGGPFGEGNEREVELVGEGAEEGEGGDGDGVGDVEVRRLCVAHFRDSLGCDVNRYPAYDLHDECP